MMEAR
jgi:hypothetical protein